MDTFVKVSGTWKAVTPFVKVGGAWKSVDAIFTKVSGVWKQVYNASITLTINLDTTSAGGVCYSGGPSNACGAISNSVTATPADGTGPYTYAWELVSGPGVSVDSPTSATTTFSATGTPSGSADSGVYRCLVTDSLGNTGYSGDVTVLLEFYE